MTITIIAIRNPAAGPSPAGDRRTVQVTADTAEEVDRATDRALEELHADGWMVSRIHYPEDDPAWKAYVRMQSEIGKRIEALEAETGPFDGPPDPDETIH